MGIRDSGQFNYHLGQLEGQFIEKTPEGYQLLSAGKNLVQTVIGGADFEEPTVDLTEIDLACPHCGAPTAITYQNQRIYHVCTACDGAFELSDAHPSSVLSAWFVDPNFLRDRSFEAVVEAIKTKTVYELAMRTGGLCPRCSGRVEGTLDVCREHAPGDDTPCAVCNRQPVAVAKYICTACKESSWSSLKNLGYTYPVMGTFAWKHGIELGYGSWDLVTMRWPLGVENDVEIISTDPTLVRVTFRYENDELALTFDQSLTVVDVTASF